MFMSNALATEPQRRSASMSSTDVPCCASVSARFTAVVVFPSPGSALVTTMLFTSRSGRAYWNIRLQSVRTPR